LTEALRREEGATGDARRGVGDYSGGILDAVDALKAFIPGSGAAGDAASQLGFSIKTALGPIGLIIAAIGLIIAAFKAFTSSTQEGQDILKKLQVTFEVVSSIITSLLSGLAKALLEPKKALEDLKNFIDGTLGNIITGIFQSAIANIVKMVAGLGLVWEKFKDNFTDNTDGIEKANARIERANERVDRANAKIQKGVDNTVEAYHDLKEAVIEVVEEGLKQIAVANKLAAAQIRYEEAIISSTTALAELNAEAEKQAAIADDATLSFQKREAAEKSARKASEEAAKINVELIKQELALLQTQNSQLAANGQLLRENRQAEADLVAAVIEAESQLTAVQFENAKRRREISKDQFDLNLDFLIDNFDNVKSVNERIANDEKRTFDERKGIIEATRNLSDIAFKEQIAELQTRTDAEINAAELLGETDSRRLIEKVRLLQLAESEESRILEVIRDRRTAIQDLAEAEQEINQQVIDANQEARLIDLENELEVNQQRFFSRLDAERASLEAQREQEIEFAERIGADVGLIEQKFSNARKELNRAEFEAKAALFGDFANNVAKIAGENTAVGKAAAVAATTISTFQGATSAFAALAPIPIVGPALGAAAAGAAVVSGIANVKKILSVKSGLPGEGSVSGGGSVSAPSTPQVTSPRASAVEDVNAGIIGRETSSIGQGGDLSVQPTLVTDQVTVDQNKEAANNQTATV